MNQDQQPDNEQQPPVPTPPPNPDYGVPTPPQEPAPEVTSPTLEQPSESEVATPPSAPPAPPSSPSPLAPPPRPTDRVTPNATEPRNLLVAMLITISFGIYGLHQVYLGRKTQGWVRFALALLAYPLTFVVVGYLVLLVLAIWTVVDFFTLYLGKRVDADGQPLTTTTRDSAWAKTIFIVAIVIGTLYAAAVALIVAFVMISGVMSLGRGSTTPGSLDYDYSDYSDNSY